MQKQKMSAEDRRRWYEQSIREGGSVMHGGRLITRTEHLPSLGELATTEAEKETALADLEERRRQLDLQEAHLRGMSEGLQSQPVGTREGQLGAGAQGDNPPPGRTIERKAGDELPKDFPGRDVFIRAGYTTLAAVHSLSREEMVALNGIGDTLADRVMALRSK